jgi:alkylated DNA repair dioxygenase AlkB
MASIAEPSEPDAPDAPETQPCDAGASRPSAPFGRFGRFGPFAADPVVDRLDLDERSWVEVVRGILPADEADRLHDQLVDDVDWQQGRVFRYERWIDEPRLSGWLRADAMPTALAEVQSWIGARYGVGFGAAGFARYRHGRDSVGLHRDREMRWLEETLIGVLTLGATRSFVMQPLGPRRDPDDALAGTIDLRPGSGDLLVMGGRCQAGWLHGVPKTATPCRSRISVQWRWTSRRGRPDTDPGYRAPRHYGSGSSGRRVPGAPRATAGPRR